MTRTLPLCIAVTTLAVATTALAAPDDKPPSTSRSGSLSKGVSKPVDYGFCSGPQNAHKFASKPVKITLGQCNDMSQSFTATSDGPSTGHNCGGFALAFGPIGKLSPALTDITMTAEWADEPLKTANECDKARVTALAWGERCVDAACSKTTWDQIEGGPKQRDGKWDGAARTCQVKVQFNSANVGYITLNLDVIADYPAGNQYVRKRAKGTIVAEKQGQKPCLTTVAPAAKK